MKRDVELIRNIMLHLEEHLVPNSIINARDLSLYDKSSNEEFQVLLEHINQLLENELIEAKPLKDLSGLREFMIFRITSKGYDFLDILRNDTVWKDVKEKASVVGGFTISLLIDLGKSYLKLKFGL
ncbi:MULTISPECIES: DUF2513 domain-containing protein [unclassified Sulfurospirillum]|uniref:DUF2513 domain-containing protein n=1 Tax=unclassified Sulfurospirillum TaxID=2618290 RepID=UPI00055B55D3|nr:MULTISPECIES: DUF2513 domain-containing protein [unclassified Sulfurospirillum]